MRMLQRPSTANQLDNQNDQRDQKQQMNISSENMEADKSKQPKNQQNNKDSPKHKKTFRLRLLPVVRFTARGRAY